MAWKQRSETRARNNDEELTWMKRVCSAWDVNQKRTDRETELALEKHMKTIVMQAAPE